MHDNKKKRGFLQKIRLTGAAGVDHPAHEHEGWLICKSVSPEASDADWLQVVADGWLSGRGVELR